MQNNLISNKGHLCYLSTNSIGGSTLKNMILFKTLKDKDDWEKNNIQK